MATEDRPARPRIAIAVLALCGMATSLQFTLVIPVVPEMPRLLSVSVDDASWIVTATLLTSAIATPVLARMADMYGKRRMLCLSLAVLTMGSVVAAVGGGFVAVLLGRAMQGFAAALIPVGISLLRDALPPQRVGAAVALMSATLGTGSALGMPLSGLLYGRFGWESLFWFSAVTGVVLVAAVLIAVPESPLRAPGRFDVVGALLLSVILTAALLVLSKGTRWGWGSGLVVGLLGVAAAGLLVWVPLQLRVARPMVDLRTAVQRPVLLTNIASVFATFAMFANMLVTVQQVQAPEATGYGFGLSVVGAGLVMLPSGLAMVALSPLSGALLTRFGGRPVLLLGCSVMAVAFVSRVFLDGNLTAIVIGATAVGVGTALAFAAMPTLIMAAVPVTETASANGINSLVRSLGTSVCSALVALIAVSLPVWVDGASFLSPAAVHLCFWVAAGSAAIAVVVGAFVPAVGYRAGDRIRLVGDDARPVTLA
ncbi:MFS transporter [Pseudonocardia lacus]|uniref:MFS transporter n=1 Tax=Pseudonocardia lacus TaxID=2835865 RepID=UPI001BDC485D|nr:MFS transporter [Pseudonocardia lacus]